MVLESIFNPFVVKKKPWEMFFAGFVYTVVGLFLSYFVFQEAAGLLTVFLIVLATVPLLYSTIQNEEELDLKYKTEWKLLKEHTKVLFFLLFLFLGITSALTIAYVALPPLVIDLESGVMLTVGAFTVQAGEACVTTIAATLALSIKLVNCIFNVPSDTAIGKVSSCCVYFPTCGSMSK